MPQRAFPNRIEGLFTKCETDWFCCATKARKPRDGPLTKASLQRSLLKTERATALTTLMTSELTVESGRAKLPQSRKHREIRLGRSLALPARISSERCKLPFGRQEQ